jgi:predicted metal-dependent hydrolase
MKESLYIIVFIIFFYILYISNNSDLVKINTYDNTKVYVRDNVDKEASAALLNELIIRMYKLRDYLVNNINNYTDYVKYINLMDENFNKTRTKIYETALNSNYTSYSINKGEELVFCLRCKSTHKLHSINLLTYVGVHEMAHTACPESGHTPLFNKIFRFMLTEAVKLNLYIYEDYSKNPVEYCGMRLYTNILNI